MFICMYYMPNQGSLFGFIHPGKTKKKRKRKTENKEARKKPKCLDQGYSNKGVQFVKEIREEIHVAFERLIYFQQSHDPNK